MFEHPTSSDIIVVGAGPSGMIAALALQKKGFRTVLIGPETHKKNNLTTALMLPALSLLKTINILDHCIEKTSPLCGIRIVDDTKRMIKNRPITFYAKEIGKDYFGLNIPHEALNEAIKKEVETKINWIKTSADEWIINQDQIIIKTKKGLFSAYLVVGADGKQSQARNAAGLFMKVSSCKQTAITLLFQHTHPHNSISTEFHTPYGSFTQIPLPNNHSALVWITSPEEAETIYSMNKDILADCLEEKMHFMLGKITIQSDISITPVLKGILNTYAQNRIALIGEAAHILPPIGAQGLNLSFRDIENLIDICSQHPEDPGKETLLKQYNKERYWDIQISSFAINCLNLSLSLDNIPLQTARSLGLFFLENIPSLRMALMQQAIKEKNEEFFYNI